MLHLWRGISIGSWGPPHDHFKKYKIHKKLYKELTSPNSDAENKKKRRGGMR